MKIRRSSTTPTSRRAKIKKLNAKISGAKERAAAARHQAEAAKADFKPRQRVEGDMGSVIAGVAVDPRVVQKTDEEFRLPGSQEVEDRPG